MRVPQDPSAQAQTRLTGAASDAAQCGLITQSEFASVTDGTVSHQNLRVAERLVENRWANLSADQQRVAEEYRNAVAQKLSHQGSISTAFEDVADFFKGK
jgi:hypothetical protein